MAKALDGRRDYPADSQALAIAEDDFRELAVGREQFDFLATLVELFAGEVAVDACRSMALQSKSSAGDGKPAGTPKGTRGNRKGRSTTSGIMKARWYEYCIYEQYYRHRLFFGQWCHVYPFHDR